MAMDEDYTLGFKELLVNYDESEIYHTADRLVEWFPWADENEEGERRSYRAVTLTPTGHIQIGGKGPFVGITTGATMPFEPSMQEVVISGSALMLGPENITTGANTFDKNTGYLTKRKFWKRKSPNLLTTRFLQHLKDFVVENEDPELNMYSVVV